MYANTTTETMQERAALEAIRLITKQANNAGAHVRTMTLKVDNDGRCHAQATIKLNVTTYGD